MWETVGLELPQSPAPSNLKENKPTQPSLSAEQLNLFNQWSGLPVKVAKSLMGYKEVKNNFEEYLQIGRLALVQCVRGFIPNENNSFKTYAFKGILNKMLCFLPKDRVVTIPTCPIFKDEADKSGRSVQLSISNSDALDKESNPDNKELASYVLNGLREKDKRILIEKYVNGKTLKEIGEIYGVSRERIRQIIQRLKDNLVRKYWRKVA